MMELYLLPYLTSWDSYQYTYVLEGGMWSEYCGRLSHHTVRCLYSYGVQNITSICKDIVGPVLEMLTFFIVF
jgi:hypothetical protein